MTIPLDDEELTALAFAADPDQPIDPNARPFVVGDDWAQLPVLVHAGAEDASAEPWQVAVVLVVVGTLLVISGLGLCITYGYLVAA